MRDYVTVGLLNDFGDSFSLASIDKKHYKKGGNVAICEDYFENKGSGECF